MASAERLVTAAPPSAAIDAARSVAPVTASRKTTVGSLRSPTMPATTMAPTGNQASSRSNRFARPANPAMTRPIARTATVSRTTLIPGAVRNIHAWATTPMRAAPISARVAVVRSMASLRSGRARAPEQIAGCGCWVRVGDGWVRRGVAEGREPGSPDPRPAAATDERCSPQVKPGRNARCDSRPPVSNVPSSSP